MSDNKTDQLVFKPWQLWPDLAFANRFLSFSRIQQLSQHAVAFNSNCLSAASAVFYASDLLLRGTTKSVIAVPFCWQTEEHGLSEANQV